MALIEGEEGAGTKGPGRGEMPQIERSMALAPSMRFTQGAGHGHRNLQFKVSPGKSAPIPDPVKPVDNCAGQMVRNG